LKTLRNLLLMTIILAFLSSCGPKLAVPTGVVPTPNILLPTATSSPSVDSSESTISDTDFPKSLVESIKTLCVKVEGNEIDDTFSEIQMMLQRKDIQVFEMGNDCDAQLLVSLEFSPISDSYQNEGGSGYSTCYTGSRAEADFSLQIQGEENIELSFESLEPTTSGTIIICPGVDGAPSGPFFEVISKGMNFYFGPSVLSWDYYPDPSNTSLTYPLNPTINASIQGPYRSDAVPYLIDILNMKPTYFKLEAIQALGELGPLATAAIPDLRNETILPADYSPSSNNFMFPNDAIIALAKIGDKETLPTLSELALSGDSKYLGVALSLLNDLDPDKGKDVLTQLLTSDNDSGLSMQTAVLNELTDMGPRAASLSPTLLEILLEGNALDPFWIEQALWSMQPIAEFADPAIYIPRIFEQAQSLSSEENCALLVASFGDTALPFIEIEVDSIPKEYSSRFFCALKTMQYYDFRLQPILPTLVKHIENDAGLSREALDYYIDALGSIGPGAISAVPVLVNKMESDLPNDTHIPEALTRITGQVFGSDVEAWTEWWNEYIK